MITHYEYNIRTGEGKEYLVEDPVVSNEQIMVTSDQLTKANITIEIISILTELGVIS